MKSIILVGPRGCGKTSVGKLVAADLNYTFVDLDEEFKKKHGEISTLVAKGGGWPEFRRLENAITREICSRNHGERFVIATGGGNVAHDIADYRTDNVRLLRSFGTVFYIAPSLDPATSASVLCDRIEADKKNQAARPSLTNGKDPLVEMTLVLSQRNRLYINSADYFIIGSLSQENAAKRIVNLYRAFSK